MTNGNVWGSSCLAIIEDFKWIRDWEVGFLTHKNNEPPGCERVRTFREAESKREG